MLVSAPTSWLQMYDASGESEDVLRTGIRDVFSRGEARALRIINATPGVDLLSFWSGIGQNARFDDADRFRRRRRRGHVSHEYESYPAVCRALRRARAERPSIAIEIVAKIGQPHFDEADFDADRFRLLIERTLADLDVPTVDVVQWLVRHTPNEDVPRIAVLERNADAIASLWNDLVAQGYVRALAVFPYSDAFLQSALKLPCVDGVVSYYNERERELEPFLDTLAMEGRSILGIRPLCAGSIREEADVVKALQFALAPGPPVAGTIVGLSSRAQIDAAVASTLI